MNYNDGFQGPATQANLKAHGSPENYIYLNDRVWECSRTVAIIAMLLVIASIAISVSLVVVLVLHFGAMVAVGAAALTAAMVVHVDF
jgi:hypothetical protein